MWKFITGFISHVYNQPTTCYFGTTSPRTRNISSLLFSQWVCINCSFSPISGFWSNRELSKRTKVRHCKPHQNNQSAYWAHVSGEEAQTTHLLLTFVFIYLFPSLQFAKNCAHCILPECKVCLAMGVFIVSTQLLASEMDHAPTINKPLWSSFGSTTKATSSKLVLVVSSVPECESAKLTSIQMNPTSLSISLYVVLKSIISSFSPTTPWSFLKTGLIAFG